MARARSLDTVRSDAQRWAAAASVAGVTALAAVLRFAGFDQVPGNPYYDAAVRSMGLSWHNFFWGAFEPAGSVSVDKIPVELWLQVASVNLFGFTSVGLRLPAAIASALAVPMLYAFVSRLFGRAAGIAAALALAVLPISILTGRSDTMDSLMMTLLVAAAWLLVAGAQRRRTWLIIVAGAVVGVAFNIKLFEAFIALPAFAALGFLLMEGSVRRRLVVLGASGLACAATSLSWLVAGSLFGAHPPWAVGSTNGSAWNVVFVFNGIDRLGGASDARLAAFDPPGLLRLLHVSGRGYGQMIGSLLIASFVLGALALVNSLLSRRRDRPPPELWRTRLAGAVGLGIWVLTGTALFSVIHKSQLRYLEAFTPAVAASAGVAVVVLARAAKHHLYSALALAAGTAATVAVAISIGHAPGWGTTAAIAGAIGTAGLSVATWLVRGRSVSRALVPALTAAALVAVLAVPFAAATRVSGSSLTSAGHGGYMPADRVIRLSDYLKAHQGGARYEAASTTIAKASTVIVRDARPVLMMTSWNGRPLISAERLAALVQSGQVRYAIIGHSSCTGAACPPVLRWARDHAVDVSNEARLGQSRLLWRLQAAPVTAKRR